MLKQFKMRKLKQEFLDKYLDMYKEEYKEEFREDDVLHMEFWDFSYLDFNKRNLTGCSFGDICFRGASFRGANLCNGYFFRVDFTGANFRGANLKGCTFFVCDLINVKLSNKQRQEGSFINCGEL